jgi:hypothetical protein
MAALDAQAIHQDPSWANEVRIDVYIVCHPVVRSSNLP